MGETLNSSKPLELAPAELLIPLKVTLGNLTYRVRHRLRPPAAEDWFAYDAALAMAIEEVPPRHADAEPGYKLELHSVEASALLWDRLACAIEGYSLPAARLPTQAGFAADGPAAAGLRADWHERVPLAHKEAAVRALQLVAPANYTGETISATGFPLQAEQVTIILEAIVAGTAYPRLMHTFRLPSADDERVYHRLLAETLVIRGSRATRTLIPSRLPALCRLYDRLIEAVEGYTVCGQPPASRDQLSQHMDAWHKRTAVQTLFGDATESPVVAASNPAEARNE